MFDHLHRKQNMCSIVAKDPRHSQFEVEGHVYHWKKNKIELKYGVTDRKSLAFFHCELNNEKWWFEINNDENELTISRAFSIYVYGIQNAQ